jgi:hypothetical protein
MPIGKSNRIVIDVEDIALKRNLYAALATEGRSLKDWFSAAANDYLSGHPRRGGTRLAEPYIEFRPRTRKGRP